VKEFVLVPDRLRIENGSRTVAARRRHAVRDRRGSVCGARYITVVAPAPLAVAPAQQLTGSSRQSSIWQKP